MREEIEHCFEYTINTTFQNSDVKRFLVNHEKRHLLFNNLEKEISKGELYYPIDNITFGKIVKDMTLQFCRAALTVKEKDIMSSNAKTEMNKKVDDHLTIMKKLNDTEMANDEELTPDELKRLKEQKKTWKKL